ncbi:MAG: N-acetyltransferase [Hyphomicrobiales bacterium]|nr:N-acetyltransferase [Hyphomicrobiales bacterium]
MPELAARFQAMVPEAAFAPEYRCRPAEARDQPGIETLHDTAFGPGALTRTAYRIREGRPVRSPYCRVIEADGAVVAFSRCTLVRIGGERGGLLLGPVAAGADHANRGLARRAILEGLSAAITDGLSIAVLVGDLGYYGRLGFVPVAPGRMALPGPVDLQRLLAIELQPDALARYGGPITGDDA